MTCWAGPGKFLPTGEFQQLRLLRPQCGKDAFTPVNSPS